MMIENIAHRTQTQTPEIVYYLDDAVDVVEEELNGRELNQEGGELNQEGGELNQEGGELPRVSRELIQGVLLTYQTLLDDMNEREDVEPVHLVRELYPEVDIEILQQIMDAELLYLRRIGAVVEN